MLNEINGLIWPSSNGIGTLDEDLWNQTITNAVEGAVLSGPPTEGAFRTDINAEALQNLRDDGVDVDGADWERQTIELKEGGE
jgi:NitT/TauT family transport system substrate-binding protein